TVSQQEVVSLYQRFCQLDRNAKVIFQVYDSDGNGKVSFDDLLDVLGDLSGSFISNEQREVHSGSARIAFFFDYCCKLHYSSFCSGLFLQQVLTRVLKEAGYTKECSLLIDDFIKVRF
ncbi:hypothetical protein LINGRAHAP2_LOCUS32136, partial [Linum grandiflorum]